MASVHDFDFLHGKWTVRHRRLRARGAGCNDWQEMAGTAETRPLLDGLCNIEEHRIAGNDAAGIALRTFDPGAERWSIYWVSGRDGVLQPPVHGGFQDCIGQFEGEDVDDGRPVSVRFLWDRITPSSARWEQSFSYDGGASWETNWTMDSDRVGD